MPRGLSRLVGFLVLVGVVGGLFVVDTPLRVEITQETGVKSDDAKDLGLLDRRKRPRVAVCVSGQPARLQPRFLRAALLANPDLDFSLFYNLQTGITVFNTKRDEVFAPSPFAAMDAGTIRENLTATFDLPNAKLAGLEFHRRKFMDEWTRLLAVAGPLDRIWQYKKSQGTILNMWSMQQACAVQISAYGSFEAVIVTREDVFFFAPPDLRKLVGKLDRNGERCDVVTKSCLAWGGLNMRFQIFHPNIVREFLGERLAFYKALIARNESVKNPEQFEKLQADHLAARLCPVTVDDLPVAAARYLPGGDFCFIGFEVRDGGKERCFPKKSAGLVMRKGCSLAKRRLGREMAVRKTD